MRASSDCRSQAWELWHQLDWRSLADLDYSEGQCGMAGVKVILQGEKNGFPRVKERRTQKPSQPHNATPPPPPQRHQIHYTDSQMQEVKPEPDGYHFHATETNALARDQHCLPRRLSLSRKDRYHPIKGSQTV